MKIAVDGYEIHSRATGVGRVMKNLLLNLASIRKKDVFYLLTQEKTEPVLELAIRQEAIPSNKGYLRWQNGPFRRRLKEIQPDLLLASNYMLPFFGLWPSILFEYDISFASHPEWYPKRQALLRNFLVKRSLQKANTVLTISEFSRDEIITHFKVPLEKVGVLPLGVEGRFQRCPQGEVEAWKEKKGLKGRVVIGYLGSIFNRRNIPLLAEAVGLLRQEIPEAFLYVVGRDLTHPPQDIARHLTQDWVRWEETLAEAELPLFYSSLAVFAFLSEYEGFGMPPLEALACGTVPVLLNTSSLGEVFQGLAFLVAEVQSLAVKQALEEALLNDQKKKACLSRFQERKGCFSWEKSAQHLSLVIDRLFPASGGGA